MANDWIDHSVTEYEGTTGDSSHITRSERGHIPTSAVANLVGVRNEKPGEHRNLSGQDWEAFKHDIATNGVRNPIFITVDYGDEPKISEGNHRRDAAVELGMTHIPAEVRYFGHAETQHKVSSLAKEGTWKEVRDKAVRIRRSGGVRIMAHQDGTIVGHVRGDTNVYESSIVFVPGRKQTGAWYCACKWAAYSWGRTGRWRKFEGRRCSHVLALQFEAQSRGMFGRTITLDENVPHWMDPTIPVKVPGEYDRNKRSYSALARQAAAYWISHRPSRGPSVDDLLAGSQDWGAPEDIYEHPQHYCDASSPGSKESIAAIKAARGKPDGMVRIYRSATEPEINTGDWVALCTEYARINNLHPTDPSKDLPVFEASVPAHYVEWAGDDLNEWGYWGPPIASRKTSMKTAAFNSPDELPPLPGESTIPEGHVRMYHYTHPDNLDSIRQHGLRLGNAKGETYGEPNQIWASTRKPSYDDVASKPFVEMHMHPDDLIIGRGESAEYLNQGYHHVTTIKDIKPENIVAIHEPWHTHARYMLNNTTEGKTPKEEYAEIIGDKHIPDDYKTAYDYIVKHSASDGGDFSDSVMVALFVPADIAQKIAVPDGLAAKDMHVTLAYLGEDLTQEQKDVVALITRSVAMQHSKLSGVIGGLGQFPAGDKGTPYFATVDVPGLTSMRETLVSQLLDAGLPVSTDHGFTPHITLIYAEDESEAPEPIGDYDITFDGLGVSMGRDERVFAFKTGKTAGIDTRVHELVGIIREYADRPLNDESLHDEIDDVSRSYRDMPILDPSAVAMWVKLGALVTAQAAQLGHVYQVIRLDDRDPYATAEEMHIDIDKGIYKVTSLHSHHPVWDVDTNVAFRVSHDILGHGTASSDFSYRGEVMAYRAECAVTPMELWPALFTEIVAQSAYANVHHLFGEQKVGVIPLTQEAIEAHVDQVMDAPDPIYDPLHVSASFRGKIRGIVHLLDVAGDDIVDSEGHAIEDEILYPDYSPTLGLTVASKEGHIVDDTIGGHDSEHALPVTYGEDEPDQNEVVATLRARLASRHTSLKDFSMMEKQELIDEGEGSLARNLGALDLSGTHYKTVEDLTPADRDEWTWLL